LLQKFLKKRAFLKFNLIIHHSLWSPRVIYPNHISTSFTWVIWLKSPATKYDDVRRDSMTL
jgi:hypothetical protein